MDFDKIIEILTVWLPQIVTVASIITAMTPTPRDNEILANIYKVIDLFAINIGRAKE